MIADVYFWSEATGTLAFKGVEYDLGYRVERDDFDGQERLIGASPSVSLLLGRLGETEGDKKTKEEMDRTKGHLGVRGLLWRAEGGEVLDMVPVLFVAARSDVLGGRRLDFRSVGQFVRGRDVSLAIAEYGR